MLLASAAVVFLGFTPSYAGGTDARTAAVARGHHASARVDGVDSARKAHQKKAHKHKSHKHKSRKHKGRKHQAHKPAHQQAGPRLWQKRTIYYYESIPAKWDWSLTTAVSKWNSSGARIRFVKVSDRKAARLVISYGSIGSRAGEATVGPMLHPWVKLSNSYRDLDGDDATNRVEVMAVFTHELGHVLGFGHTTARCSLMSPVMDIVGCGTVKPADPGYYKCRTIPTSLETRLVRDYGGSVRVPANTWCLVDPVPPTLQHVTFTGGESPDTPVTVNWDVPSATPAGSTVEIRSWSADTCDSLPAWAAKVNVPVSSAAWSADSDQAGDRCFTVELVNRYGIGQQPVAGRVVARPAAEAASAGS